MESLSGLLRVPFIILSTIDLPQTYLRRPQVTGKAADCTTFNLMLHPSPA